ncbi:WD repeat-containing protein RUP2 [Apostasia shenzhenica]|uniref:WD repeat-containing protein RUP2 n=1 Tax=Apostasia shenzhenica TaxID=1088818 RepID=A0A2I0AR52_9ASPA|nr:WD repeat-containing protein RUP2 [Apostasia shenzhenica]
MNSPILRSDLDDEDLPSPPPEDRVRCEWDFRLSSVLRPPEGASPAASDALGAIDVDPSNSILATGGMARKIRVYSLTAPTNPCSFFLCTPAKLSCLRFRPDAGGRLIAAADYDGVVTEYDLEHRAAVSERDEHGGRRVWSVDFSPGGALGSSGADDGSALLWDPRCPAGGGSAATIRTGGAPVCCVEFDRADAGPWVGLGCADRRAYVYDLRALGAGPVTAFAGHGGVVTYVRFAGAGRVVSSGTDGAHRLWEAPAGKEVRAFLGHQNRRSFVGLAVWRGGGLIGSGSESNEVFVYDLRWGEPVWVRRFGGGREDGFVGAVCWRGNGSDDECELIAGGSDGVVQIFACRRACSFS